MGLILMQGGFAALSDGYFSAQAILVYLFAVIGAITTRPLMPYLTSLKGKDVAALSVGVFLSALLLAGGLQLVLTIWSEAFTQILLFGANDTRLTITHELLQIMLCSSCFFACCSCFQACAQHQGKFVQVETICIGSHLLSIALLLLITDAVQAIGWSYVVRYGVRALAMAFFFPWSYLVHADVTRVWSLTRVFLRKVGQLIAGSALSKAMGMADVFFSSFLGDGALSLIKTISFLYGGVSGIANRSYFMPLVWHIGISKREHHDEFSQQLAAKLPIVVTICCLSAMAITALIEVAATHNIVPRGDYSFLTVSTYVAILAFYMAGDLWGNSCTALFYARGDMLTPTIVGVISMGAAVLYKYALTTVFAEIGLVSSIAVHYLVNAMVLHYVLSWGDINRANV